MNIFPGRIAKLNVALDVIAAKHAVIASNIANIDTPGYKAKTINFKDALLGAMKGGGLAMKQTASDHMAGASIEGSMGAYVQEQVNDSMRNDGNNVNIDKEMLALSKNNIMYNVASQIIGNQFNYLKYATSEGRRA